MDRTEFETMIVAHQAEIYRYVRYLGAGVDTVEDIVQDVFVAALSDKQGPVSQEPRARAAWLRGIARHKFLSHCRRQRTSPVLVSEELVDQSEHVWTKVFLRSGDGFDYLEALRSCLKDLPPKGRHILELCYIRDRSRAEMATACGMTEDGVKSALGRLRASLADCVARRIGLEGGR